jgi:hypothetical protein
MEAKKPEPVQCAVAVATTMAAVEARRRISARKNEL